MKQAIIFDDFSFQCSFFDSEDESSNGYGCKHERNDSEGCFCHTCPLGIEAEQEDLTNPEHPDAIKDEIDWDGLCEDGKVTEGEYLLLEKRADASQEEQDALYSYERYMHRYDKKWLDEHGIVNSLVE